jgi:hypothetical protein
MICPRTGEVDRHFGGRLGAEAERAMREHLAACDPCRERYRRQWLLAELSPRGRSAKTRLRRGIAVASSRRPRVALVALSFAGTAAALVIWASTPSFTPRGAPVPRSATEVKILRVHGGVPEPLGERMSARDELGFVYRNPTGKRRLCILSVDELGHVYWYHPAWTDADANPTAVVIDGGEGRHELPEAIAHAYAGTSLRFISIFTDEALTVRKVEAWLRAHGPPLPGALVLESFVRVNP